MIKKYRKQLLIFAIAALAAAAMIVVTSRGGGVSPKLPGPTVDFIEPFIVNLADPGGTAYANLKLSIQLAPMTVEDKAHFDSGGEGGGHGAKAVPGAEVAGKNPALRDAVVDAVTSFTANELLSPQGKKALESRLLASFKEIQEEQEAALKKAHKGGGHVAHNPAHPPYHVEKVFFTDFAIQPAG